MVYSKFFKYIITALDIDASGLKPREYMSSRWFLDLYFNLQWMRVDDDIWRWKDTTYQYKKTKKMGITTSYRVGGSSMGNRQYATSLDMSTI